MIAALAETTAALGIPLLVKVVGPVGSPSAVVVRWRHGDAVVDISPSDTTRVIVSLKNGHRVEPNSTNGIFGKAVKVGNVAVFSSRERTRVTIKGKADVLQIFVAERFLYNSTESLFDCPRLLNVHDCELQAAALQLLVGSVRNDSDDSLLLEAGIHRIAARLHAHAANGRPDFVRGGLAPTACRRVDELIGAALEEPGARAPTLLELAGAANLSVNHFIRAFRQEKGVTPHRHLVRCRLERAIALLERPGQSVAEVAAATGFATPAHFVATFRRTMGVTPGALRAALSD